MTTETATPEALEPETVEPAGAETTEASVETTPSPGELVLARGVGIDIWRDTASTFVPVLKKDMPMEQRREAVRQVIDQSQQIDDRLNLVAGEMLYEVSVNEYWKTWEFVDADGVERAFKTFEEYCTEEANMQKRKAYYLISIYRVFCVDLDIPVDVLRDLEWAKAKELAKGKEPVITQDNWEELLGKIEGMSVRQVKEMVAAMRGGSGKVETDREKFNRLTFNVNDEQLKVVNDALDLAKTMSESDKPGWLLELICADFAASSAGVGKEAGLIKLDIAKRNLERAFGVKLEIVDVDSERYAGVGEGGEDDDE